VEFYRYIRFKQVEFDVHYKIFGTFIMSVEIFVDSEFSGTASGSLDQDYSSIDGFWNDKISSIKVYSGTWAFFEHSNYQGKSFQLTPGEYPCLNDIGMNDVISSFKQVGQDTPSASSGGSMAQEILDAHNSYRAQVGVPPLTWSDTLASQALEWAQYLSDNLKFEHSQDRQGVGENLWIGSSGHFSFTQMIQSFGNEQQHFVGGTFPNVSNTGNWGDVGHYTQMVWKNTTEVGCAGIDGSDGMYRLVCRYSPSGNVIGQSVY
jgi:hypothetical protein